MLSSYFEFVYLKCYSSNEILNNGQKKFRRVFEINSIDEIFFDLLVKNEKYGEENWIANIKFKCYKFEGEDGDTKVLYEIEKRELIELNEQYKTFSNSIFTKERSSLENGAFLCTVEINEHEFRSQFFFITSTGVASYNDNPYFSIEDIKLFRQTENYLIGISKRQLNQFSSVDTDYIYIDMHLKNHLANVSWFCELYISFYTASGELKGKSSYFQIINDPKSDCLISIRIGSGEKGFWQEGNYKAQVSFQDIIVAQCFFAIGDEDIEGEVFTETNAREIARIDEIEIKKKEGLKFDKILEVADATEFPEAISDEFAVKIAYKEEIDKIVSYLSNGLSVLLICDKILIEFLYPSLCRLSGKRPVLDNFNFDAKEFIKSVQSLDNGSIFIIRNLEIISDLLLGSSILFQTRDNGLPHILAFTDSSMPVKDILRGRFALSERLQGIPRDIELKGERKNPLPYLITREEHALFKKFKSDELYKHVLGLNIIQFRNAIKYLRTKFERPTEANEIYDALRIFKLHSTINSMELPETTFEDIGGYDELKNYIKVALSLFKNAEKNIDQELQKELTPKGFVFFGPPGTGKTMLAKAIANHLNATIQMISGPEIVEMWVGKSEENLRKIFSAARRNAPSVILFDEFDSIATKRSNFPSGSAMSASSLMAQLLTELDGFQKNDGVLVIGTTNRIDSLDPALMRPSRLLPLYVDKPDLDARKKVALVHARKFGVEKIICQIVGFAIEFFEDWKSSSEEIGERQIPEGFFNRIFDFNPRFREKSVEENIRIEYSKEHSAFFKFIGDLDLDKIQDELSKELFRSITNKLSDLNQEYNSNLSKRRDAFTREDFSKSFEDIYLLLDNELKNTPEFLQSMYFQFLIDMIAEFTEDFNNDEIGSLFKDAIIAYSLEGRILSPKYFGEKIGLLKTMKETKTMTSILLRS